MSEPIFGRVVTAMVTPFTREGELDAPRAAELARRLVEMGSDGLVVTGTTGESPALATEEKVRLWETVLEAVGDRVPVVAGTGTNCTRDSVHLTRLAEKAGASGVMLVTPITTSHRRRDCSSISGPLRNPHPCPSSCITSPGARG